MTMKCPVCGAAELIHDTRDLPYTYKGETTTIPAVTADFCPACDESITDMAETGRVMREMQAFNKQVNAATVDPGFIANVRKKLDLGQREAAQIFGGGVNAFSRYETGKTRPPLALVKLLKVLDRHPELLDEVRAA
jgi:HTH-type transcriptional regulator/antitoxin MqsA